MELFNAIKKFVLPVYPFLFGLFPVLYLWNANRTQEPAYVVIPSLLITLGGVLVIYLLALAIVRSIQRAALITTIFTLYILTFGHIDNLIKTWKLAWLEKYLLPGSALVILAILIYIAIRKLGSTSLTKTLNLVSAAMVLIQVVSATPYYINIARLQKSSTPKPGQSSSVPVPVSGGGRLTSPIPNQPQRDVYFILLDNYGRQDILQKGSNIDNSALVDALKARGFVFPDCAQGNYMDTAPVIGSILNMDYLNNLGIQDKSYIERGHYQDLAPLILNSKVIKDFKAMGYHTVTFRGFMGLIDIQSSDTYVSFDKDLDYSQRLETLNFNNLYFKTTIFSPINDQYKIYPDMIMQKGPDYLKKLVPSQEILQKQYYEVYEQNLYAFDALRKIPTQIPGPKFVYAHMYAAHWPFMMKPDGSLRLPFTQEQTVAGYLDGVQYTNNHILADIDAILNSSKTKPVIIIQGDHSNEWTRPVEWSGKDRVKILSAYYLPDGGDKLLYPTISPVNNFRLIFQKYFGQNISLLPDVNRYLDPKTKKVGIAPSTCMSTSIP